MATQHVHVEKVQIPQHTCCSAPPNTALQFGRPYLIVWSNDEDESVFNVLDALIHSGIYFSIIPIILSFGAFLSLKVCPE